MNRQKTNLLFVLFPMLLAIGLMTGPREIGEEATLFIRDILKPGQQLLANTIDFTGDQLLEIEARNRTEAQSQIDRLRNELQQLKLENRRQQLANANLWEQWKQNEQFGSGLFRGVKGKRLFVQELVEATVLGQETTLLWQGGTLLGEGKKSGLRESDLVLASNLSLIDQGEQQGLMEGQAVFLGQCVAGRIQKVGLWSSTVQHVSDKKFRANAQLVQRSKNELRYGSKGILEGTGDGLCKLRYVDAQQAVNVGDPVYTQRDDGLSVPMYFGKVIEAKILPGETHWEILVEPAVKKLTASKVYVLRKKLNPARIIAN